jgi:hypothetical protein
VHGKYVQLAIAHLRAMLVRFARRNDVPFGGFGRASLVIPSRDRASLEAQFAAGHCSREFSHEIGWIEQIEHTESAFRGPWVTQIRENICGYCEGK